MESTSKTSLKSNSSSKERENPFPGTRSFKMNETNLFFGRKGEEQEIISKLKQNKFVAIIGAASSGKSSLVNTTVLSELAKDNWQFLTMNPGGSPLEYLANALIRINEVNTELTKLQRNKLKSDLISCLLDENKGLSEAVKLVVQDNKQQICLVVDQFEEIFRYKEIQENIVNEKLTFVKLLVEAVRLQETPITVVLSFRSDYLGNCSQYQDLTSLINHSYHLVPKMNRVQLVDIIKSPLFLRGVKIEDDLVELILNDVEEDEQLLPKLQHSLFRTYDFWSKNSNKNKPISIEHYKAIGGVQKAISNHADELFDSLSEEDQMVVEKLFSAITLKGTGNEIVRRPQKLEMLANILDESEDKIFEIVNKYRGIGVSFLLPEYIHEINADSIVDISSEAFAQNWKKLALWANQEERSKRMYLRLCEASTLFQEGKTGLWRPPDLQLGQNWLEERQPKLNWAKQYDVSFEKAIVFLQTSIEEYELEEENKRKLQRAQLKRARITALILGSAAVVSIVFLVYSIFQTIEATKQKEIAEQQKIIAQEKEAEAEKQTEIAKEKEVEAEKQAKIAEENAAEAERQANIAIAQTKIAEIKTNEALNSEKKAVANAEIAKEQTVIANEAKDNAYKLRMLTISQSMAIKSTQIEDTVLKSLVAKQAYDINTEHEGKKHNPDVYNGLYRALKVLNKKDYNTLKGHTDKINSTQFTSNGNLFTAASDGRILQWDINAVQTPTKVIASGNNLNRVIAVSSNGKWLALGTDKKEIQLFDLNSNDKEPILLEGHNAMLFDLQFSSNSETLVSTAADSTIRIWNLKTKIGQIIKRGNTNYRTMALTKNGKKLYAGNNLGKVFEYNLNDGFKEKLIFEQTQAKRIYAIALSNKNNLLAIGDAYGHLYIYDLIRKSIKETLRGHRAIVTEILFTSNDELMYSASSDGSVRFWDLTDADELPVILDDNDSYIWSIAGSPDGKYLLTGSKSGILRKWSTSTETMSTEICAKLKRNLSQKEWNQYVGEDIKYELTCPEYPAGEGAVVGKASR